ncbi:M23 family metallopeptidase, partial [bacterium]|nr:M23 family metallopeptidase [candidate division CSSED10-310 bacterium]
NLMLYKYIQSMGDLVRGIPSISPVEHGFVSSPFGRRKDPFTGSIKLHTGIDIAHPSRIPVLAAAEGVVIQSDWNEIYGNVVTINHAFSISTRYAHLDKVYVKPGEWVDRGHIIGLLGNTGRSTHRHLHYEVRIEGKPVNPCYFLPDEEQG